MEFDLSRWHGVSSTLFGSKTRLETEEATHVLHALGADHIGRDLLRALNADDDEKKPFWTMAESAAWDLRGNFGWGPVAAQVVGTVPGRELCVRLAHTDIGFYLASYAIQDFLPFESAVRAMGTQGGMALSWRTASSATKFISQISRDERFVAFAQALRHEDGDTYGGLSEESLSLAEHVASGLISGLARDIQPGAFRDLREHSVVAQLAEDLEWIRGGADAISCTAEVLADRAAQPQTRSDEIYQNTLRSLDPAESTAVLIVSAIVGQLSAIPAAIALLVALNTKQQGMPHTSAVQSQTIFGLLEELISELERSAYELREQTLAKLAQLALERDRALDAFAWAEAERRRMCSLIDELRAEKDLLGEQLLAEQRRRLLESRRLRKEVDDLVRQSGIDNDVIRELNAYIDSRQRRRLREAMRDVVAGASLGGTIYGTAGVLAGGILGLLGAVADEARD